MSTIAAKIGPGAQTGPREAFEEPRRSVHPVGHPRTGLRQPQGPAGRAAYLWTAGGGEGPSSRGPGDRAFVTPGSVTAGPSYAGDDRAPGLIQDQRDSSWRQRDTIITKGGDFGRSRAGGR